MSYVSQEDVILYVDAVTSFQAGQDVPVRLIVYKDYLNTQLNLNDVDSITVTIFDDVGRRVLSYTSPEIPGKTLPLTIGDEQLGQGGYIEFTIQGIHPHDIATILDETGVAIRAGHHCCQILHDKLNIPASARASLGVYNTKDDLDKLNEGINNCKKIFDLK